MKFTEDKVIILKWTIQGHIRYNLRGMCNRHFHLVLKHFHHSLPNKTLHPLHSFSPEELNFNYWYFQINLHQIKSVFFAKVLLSN